MLTTLNYCHNETLFNNALDYFCNIDFENDQLCRLNISSFVTELVELAKEPPAAMTFNAIVLNQLGDLEVIPIDEQPQNPKSKSLESIYHAQEAVKAENFVLAFLYPEITKKDFSRLTNRKISSDALINSKYSKQNYQLIWEDVVESIMIVFDIYRSNVIENRDYLTAWFDICNFYHKTILFGAYSRKPDLPYEKFKNIQLTTQFAKTFNELSCLVGGLLPNINFLEESLTLTQSTLFLKAYFTEIPRVVEEYIIDLCIQHMSFSDILLKLKVWPDNSNDLSFNTRYHIDNLHAFQVARILKKLGVNPF